MPGDGACPAPSLGDLGADGRLDAWCVEEESSWSRVRAWTEDGTLTSLPAGSAQIPWPGQARDLDGDGWEDLVGGSDGCRVWVHWARTR